MAVAGFTYDQLPSDEQASLPGEAELVEVVEDVFARLDEHDPERDDGE